MAYNSSLTGYPDIIKALDSALASTKGIRVAFTSEKEVTTFCGRVHTFRHLDRKANMKIYSEGDPMHGKSAYDVLTLRKEGTKVAILKLDAVEFKTEEIT